MKIIVIQDNFTVGDFSANLQKHLFYIDKYKDEEALLVFSELSLCGYPPEDMGNNKEFADLCNSFGHDLVNATKGTKCDILFGNITTNRNTNSDKINFYNSVIIASNGVVLYSQSKYDLPNYGVFDEKRTFKPAPSIPRPITYKQKQVGILICEDLWNVNNAEYLKGCDVIFGISASPFEKDKRFVRQKIVADIVNYTGANLVYTNQICGHDDLVFDGGSFISNNKAEIIKQAKHFECDELLHDFRDANITSPQKVDFTLSFNDDYYHIYHACMLGLRDYVGKNNFSGVLLGLSGGIDSALTAVMAADAIGAANVNLYMLPSKYTSNESLEDAKELAKNMGINLGNMPINNILDMFLSELEPYFLTTSPDLTEENLQSRIRGNLLMALSNKNRQLLLTTGNKSEVAVGYSTLYGDMCGGYNLLKDIYKTDVFALCEWRNENRYKIFHAANVIPKNIITKPPTAELREGQKDEDSLPPYEILDKILYFLVEEELSTQEITAKGFDKNTVMDIEKLLFKAEFKRRQSAIGVKISKKPFGRDRRYPITNKFLWY